MNEMDILRAPVNSAWDRVAWPFPGKAVSQDFADMERQRRAIASTLYGGSSAMTVASPTGRPVTITADQIEQMRKDLELPEVPKHYEDLGTVPMPEPKKVFKVRGSDYKQNMMQPRKMRDTLKMLKREVPKLLEEHNADVLIAVGTSGCAIVAPLASMLDMPWILVRKASDVSHGQPLEGKYEGNGRGIFIDDCVSSGDTLRHAFNMLHTHCDPAFEIPAVVCYNDSYPGVSKRGFTLESRRVSCRMYSF